MLIDFFGVLVFRVNDNRAYSNDFRCLQNSSQRINDESGAEPFALPILVDTKPCKQDDRNRVARNSFHEALWRVFKHNFSGYESVEPDDSTVGQCNVSLCRMRSLTLKRVSSYETVQGLRATLEVE